MRADPRRSARRAGPAQPALRTTAPAFGKRQARISISNLVLLGFEREFSFRKVNYVSEQRYKSEFQPPEGRCGWRPRSRESEGGSARKLRRCWRGKIPTRNRARNRANCSGQNPAGNHARNRAKCAPLLAGHNRGKIPPRNRAGKRASCAAGGPISRQCKPQYPASVNRENCAASSRGLSRAVHQESSCPAHAHRARASCLPDSNPYGRDGLAHSRSPSTARRALRVA